MIKDAKQSRGRSDDLVVDLHPDRPVYRGIALPEHIISLEADPTIDELSDAGAVVSKSNEAHTVLDDMFLISGEIPRLTPYETGLKNAVRYDPDENDWFSDELIADERFLACNIKGKHDSSFVLVSRISYSAYLIFHRKRNSRLHRLQPRRRRQYHKERPQTHRNRCAPPRSSWRLPSCHERRRADSEYGIRPETS